MEEEEEQQQQQPSSNADAESKGAALVGAPGHSKVPYFISKPVVGENIALHAVLAHRAFSIYLVFVFPWQDLKQSINQLYSRLIQLR